MLLLSESSHWLRAVPQISAVLSGSKSSAPGVIWCDTTIIVLQKLHSFCTDFVKLLVDRVVNTPAYLQRQVWVFSWAVRVKHSCDISLQKAMQSGHSDAGMDQDILYVHDLINKQKKGNDDLIMTSDRGFSRSKTFSRS